MAHGDPFQIFVQPVKQTIKDTIVDFGPFRDLDVVFNQGIERDGTFGASITLSRQIPPVANRTDEKPSGGSTGQRWLDANGLPWERFYRSRLILHFDVTIWTPHLSSATEALFYLVGMLPRHCCDGHLQTNNPDPDESYLGNPIELSCLAPMLPDDRTNVGRSYKSSVIVRAEGGIYVDKQRKVSVTPFLSVKNSFAK